MSIPISLRKISIVSLLILPAVVLTLAGNASAQEETKQATLEELQERIDQLESLAVRTQSHVMFDVEYHFSNLWFAAHSQQWDLAAFYLRETASHLGWAVRIRPERSVAGGGTVDLRPFEQSMKQGSFSVLKDALEKQNVAAFENAYKQTLPQCHACHEASGLGYLDPHIPETPPSSLMIRMP